MKGIDQAALAERCGVSKSTISRILSGVQEPKLRLAYDLARALGVTLDYLVEESQEVDPSVQLVPVTADEQTILKIVRRLGTDVAIDRLLGVERPPTSEAAGGRGPASEAKGQGGREQNG
ncbi:MAG: helix-turn-helix transcriptional regulator, partial [Isosphaeraceae bacterium]|nr:helix-turn-helix transcriptional regulator [Isosphaeraceae bacterium]